MIERSHLLLELHKKFAFKGGHHNEHTPKEGHWLPRKFRKKHNSAPYRSGPKGKLKPREGHPLRDEPKRHAAEPRVRRLAASSLVRTGLLLAHDKPT